MRFSLLILLMVFAACAEETHQGGIARVNDSWLYPDDLDQLVPPGTSPQDSLAMVRHYIDQWAAQRLLLDAAHMNLTDAQKAGFDKLVDRYRDDLYTTAYLDALVKQKVDTLITQEELKAFYDQGRENFRTTAQLVRLRYIRLRRDNPKFAAIKARFFNFKKADAEFWDEQRLNFTEASLNDSAWVEMSQVYARLPFITPENRERHIAPGKSIEHPDSTGVYLVKIVGVISQNQPGPYEYLKPTMREVILNKRKLELMNKLEKDITDDAIKEKKYEIFK